MTSPNNDPENRSDLKVGQGGLRCQPRQESVYDEGVEETAAERREIVSSGKDNVKSREVGLLSIPVTPPRSPLYRGPSSTRFCYVVRLHSRH